jgi:hypothetical protein
MDISIILRLLGILVCISLFSYMISGDRSGVTEICLKLTSMEPQILLDYDYRDVWKGRLHMKHTHRVCMVMLRHRHRICIYGPLFLCSTRMKNAVYPFKARRIRLWINPAIDPKASSFIHKLDDTSQTSPLPSKTAQYRRYQCIITQRDWCSSPTLYAEGKAPS